MSLLNEMFFGSGVPLPALSSLTTRIPFDGSFAGTHQRNSNAWNPETGVVAPHNLFLNSATGVTQNITASATPTAGQMLAGVAHSLAFKGTGSITISGTGSGTLAGTGATDRVTLAFTPTAGTVTFTVTGSITEVQVQRDSFVTYIVTGASAIYGPRYVSGKTGLLIEEASAQLFVNSQGTAAVTQNIAVTTANSGKWTCSVFGAGTVTSSAGTATATGYGAATPGTPNTITVTGNGTVTYTVTGATAATIVNVENLPYATSPIVSGATVPVTRAADVVTYPTSYTNLMLQSNGFSDAGWIKASLGTGTIPVLSPNQSDPFGGTNGWRLQMYRGDTDVVGNYSNFQRGVTSAINTHTLSVYLKSNTGSSQTIRLSEPTTGNSSNIIVTTSWQRFTLTSAASTNPVFSLITRGTYGTDQNIDLLIYHVQVEALPYATAIIPTTTAAVTYANLTAAQGTINFWFNNDFAKQSSATIMNLIEHGTTAANNLMRVRKSAANQYGFHVSDAAGTLCGADVAQTLTAAWHMMTLTWGAAGTFGYIDAVQVVADTTGIVVPAALASTFSIGQNISNLLQADTSVDNINAWSVSLTQAQITQAYRSGR